MSSQIAPAPPPPLQVDAPAPGAPSPQFSFFSNDDEGDSAASRRFGQTCVSKLDEMSVKQDHSFGHLRDQGDRIVETLHLNQVRMMECLRRILESGGVVNVNGVDPLLADHDEQGLRESAAVSTPPVSLQPRCVDAANGNGHLELHRSTKHACNDDASDGCENLRAVDEEEDHYDDHPFVPMEQSDIFNGHAGSMDSSAIEAQRDAPEGRNSYWGSKYADYQKRVQSVRQKREEAAEKKSYAERNVPAGCLLCISSCSSSCDNAGEACGVNRFYRMLKATSKSIVKITAFDYIFTVILLSNCGFMAVEIEYRANNPDLPTPHSYMVIDKLFTTLFVIETAFRMMAAGLLNFFVNADWRWNIFDFSIVVLMLFGDLLTAIVENGAMGGLQAVRIVRVIRVFRVLRIVRTMRFFRALRMLITAILSTVKECVYTVLLLLLMMYTFSILFVLLVLESNFDRGDPAYTDTFHYFGNIPRTIFTLYKAILGGIDWEVATDALADVPLAVPLFLFYVTTISLAVLNVVTGLFCNSAIETAYSDQKDSINRSLHEREKYEKDIETLFNELDKDGDGTLSLEEFEDSLRDDRMKAFIKVLDIEVQDAFELYKLLDENGSGSISSDEFVEGCMRLKGSARTIHLAQLMYENKWIMERLTQISLAVGNVELNVCKTQGRVTTLGTGYGRTITSHNTNVVNVKEDVVSCDNYRHSVFDATKD